jgi:hypothetical protein
MYNIPGENQIKNFVNSYKFDTFYIFLLLTHLKIKIFYKTNQRTQIMFLSLSLKTDQFTLILQN